MRSVIDVRRRTGADGCSLGPQVADSGSTAPDFGPAARLGVENRDGLSIFFDSPETWSSPSQVLQHVKRVFGSRREIRPSPSYRENQIDRLDPIGFTYVVGRGDTTEEGARMMGERHADVAEWPIAGRSRRLAARP
jgi:hypothetical protein